MTYSIYIILVNEKYYVGLFTTSIEQRTKQHKYCAKSGDSKCLYNALRKYNMVETFELIVIDTAETFEELCEKEKEYIIKYNSYYKNGKGYNMTYGGEGAFGYIHTDDDLKKNSEAHKKYYEDNPYAGKKHSEALKKYYKDNPDAREKSSDIKKKYYIDNPYAGKKHSEALKKYYKDNQDAREKRSELLKKYYEDNEDARKKNSEAQKKKK